MHTDVHHKICIKNETLFSIKNAIYMIGFFRVPKLSELAFIKIQKMMSAQVQAGCRNKFSAYDGGITEEDLKKLIGLDSMKALLPNYG